MNEFIFFMHNDAPMACHDRYDWEGYFTQLRESGHFAGSSAIGEGTCMSKNGTSKPISTYLTGFIRVFADDMEQARELVIGNPVFEAGGTVEIRELPLNE